MEPSSKSLMIQMRIWDEHITRNQFASVPHLLILGAALIIHREMFEVQSISLISPGLILFACGLRGAITRSLRYGKVNLEEKYALYCVSFALLSTGWGVLYHFIDLYYGQFSDYSMLAIILLAALCSSGVTTLGAVSPFAYFCFNIPMTVILIGRLGVHSSFNLLVTGCVLAFTLFHFYQVFLAHRYLKSAIDTELELKWEHDKLQGYIDAVPGFVSFIDTDLCYRSINHFGKKFYPEDLMIGQKVGFMHPNSAFATFIHEFMESDREAATSEVCIDFIPGHQHFILSVKRLHGMSGGAVVVSIPIDELVIARENLKSQEAKAVYTAKLVSLGEMAAGIAHEINNPLAIIQGSTDQIARQLSRPDFSVDRIITYNAKIQETVTRISRIIKSLKGLARNGEKDPHMPFKFQSILEPCLEISRQRFRDKEIKFLVGEFNPLLEFRGQEIQISQVLMNLLNNAYDAAVENELDKWIKLDVIEGESFVDIRVQDSGKGIPEAIRKRIMEPFFTTKPMNKGTGLGLSISKSIMDDHGGSLIIDEASPHTTFIMRMRKS